MDSEMLEDQLLRTRHGDDMYSVLGLCRSMMYPVLVSAYRDEAYSPVGAKVDIACRR
jgi:hypothetical protein